MRGWKIWQVTGYGLRPHSIIILSHFKLKKRLKCFKTPTTLTNLKPPMLIALRRTDRQTDGQTDGQTDRQTDGQRKKAPIQSPTVITHTQGAAGQENLR